MIERILVPLDGSDLSARALPHATGQAAKFKAQIVLLRVAESRPSSDAVTTAASEDFGAQEDPTYYVERVAEPLRGEGLEVECCVHSGPPAESIVTFATTEDIDLIIMSTHGRSGVGRWVYGSVADKVLRAADVPVFLIRVSENGRCASTPCYRRLLVPLDGSELAELALQHAEEWAYIFGAEVILLRVPTLPPYVSLGPDASMMVPSLLSEAYAEADAYLSNVCRRLKAKGLVVHKAAVEPGAVADTIIDYARDAGIDCIVMSTHGRGGLRRWVYGSVADRVLRGAGMPVLLIRAPRAKLSIASDQ